MLDAADGVWGVGAQRDWPGFTARPARLGRLSSVPVYSYLLNLSFAMYQMWQPLMKLH